LVIDRNLSSHANLGRILDCGYDYVAGLSLSGRIKQLVLSIPVQAHVFICFLAYLLWCLLDDKLIRKLAKRYSVQRALEILHRIKLTLLRIHGSDQIFRQLSVLTTEQRELLLAAGLDPP